MTGGLEAAGDALTGGVIARAVEPGHGEATATNRGLCLNCGTQLDGTYCHRCGQAAHVHRTLSAIWHDIAHSVFHFEGKFWRTLPMLAWRPGELTRRYVHGERARFISPLALFLFCVFLMFAVFESVGGPVRIGGSDSGAFFQTDLKKELAAQEWRVSRLKGVRENTKTAASRAQVDAQLKEAEAELEGIRRAAGMVGAAPFSNWADTANIQTGSPEANARLRAAIENPKLLAYKLQSNAYKFAWALIPLSMPFMWAMFAWRRQYRIYDHAVFVTYSLAFTMLLLIAMALLIALGASAAEWLTLLLPLHFYRQLKQAYQLRRASALWRTALLLIVAFTVLLTFGVLLLLLGLTG